MTATLIATRTDDQTVAQSSDNDLVNAIRDGKLVEVRFYELTSDEKRAAYNALFNPSCW